MSLTEVHACLDCGASVPRRSPKGRVPRLCEDCKRLRRNRSQRLSRAARAPDFAVRAVGETSELGYQVWVNGPQLRRAREVVGEVQIARRSGVRGTEWERLCEELSSLLEDMLRPTSLPAPGKDPRA